MVGTIVVVACLGAVGATCGVVLASRSSRHPDVDPASLRRARVRSLASVFAVCGVFALVGWLVTRSDPFDPMVWLALSVLLVCFGCACLGFVLGGTRKDPSPMARKLRTDAILGIGFLFVIGPVLAVLVAKRVN
jgi:drug/metabolite transporter (DMT)-like permease